MQGVFRNVKAPNVYLREIDRSMYGDGESVLSEVDNNVVVCGFANKGPILEPRKFIRLDDFIATYGYPSNEAERYFHNAANEVLTEGATLIACRLPYDNNSYEHVTFCEYEVSDTLEDVYDRYPELQIAYPEIAKCLCIKPKTSDNGTMPFETWDSLVTGSLKPKEKTFVIVNTTGNKYVRDDYYKDRFPGLKPQPRTLTITVFGDRATRTYNGSEIQFTGTFTASCSDPAFDLRRFSYTGNTVVNGTDVGTYSLNPSEEFCHYNDSLHNVEFVMGDPVELVINKINITVNVDGHSNEQTYSGESYDVEGYDIWSDSPLYNERNVSFSGTASVSGTDCGTYLMGLDESQFEYNDENVTAVFNITDGRLVIVPVEFTVDVHGNQSEITYDGIQHVVSGYEMRSNSRFYDENKVEFNGCNEVSGTNAGVYPIGLDSSQFAYNDSNANVTFDVTDGQLVVSKANLTLQIFGHSLTVPRDYDTHTVNGYDLTATPASLFKTEYFGFTGNASVSGTEVGTYHMGLNKSQFSYTDPNINASFQIVDGVLVIDSSDIVPTIVTFHDGSEIYIQEAGILDRQDILSAGLSFNGEHGTWGMFDENHQWKTAVGVQVGTKINELAGGNDAPFSGWDSLQFVKIPNNVNTIRSNAFRECSNITYIEIPGKFVVHEVFSGSYTTITTAKVNEGSNFVTSQMFYGCGSLSDVTIPESVELIGASAFSGCTTLSQVTLPESNLNSIGESAFSSCSKLEFIEIPSAVTLINNSTFNGCTSLSSVSIKGEIERIGNHAFYGCTALSSFSIPDSTTQIGKYAFFNCSNLESVTFGNEIETIGEYAFKGCGKINPLVLNDNLKEIGKYAFSGCSGFDTLTVPDSVTDIKEGAFENCHNLESVTIGNATTNIGYHAFYNCGNNLSSVVIPNSVSAIGSDAFGNCNGVTDVTIPGRFVLSSVFPNYTGVTDVEVADGSTSIAQMAFYNCTGIRSINIPDGVTNLYGSSMQGCSNLTAITIPDSVTTIMDSTFRNCSSLSTVVIPDSVTKLDRSVFVSCTNLQTVTIGNNVPDIGPTTFDYCTSLTSITIPDSVTKIEKFAFRGCSNMSSLTLGNKIEWIREGAFAGCSKISSISIPDSVTRIDSSAFHNCHSAAFVKISESLSSLENYVFGSCHSLSSVIIPNSVTRLGGQVFAGCSILSSIVIPNSVTTIGEHIFSECPKLSNITLPGRFTISQIGHLGGITDATVADGSTEMTTSMFERCLKLSSVTIPNSVNRIQPSAFNQCTALSDITIPDYVTYIGNHTFSNCTSLSSIELSESLDGVSEGMFLNCASLESITIPDSVRGIGLSAFESCTHLKQIMIGSGVTYITGNAFKSCPIERVYITDLAAWCQIEYYFEHSNPLDNGGRLFLNEVEVTNVTIPRSVENLTGRFGKSPGIQTVIIPSNVKTIGNSVFAQCENLETLLISDGPTVIGTNAFRGSPIHSLTIPGSVKKIAAAAFYGCDLSQGLVIEDGVETIDGSKSNGAFSATKITSVTIPSSVKTIGNHTFSTCPQLTSVTIVNGDNDVNIGENAFGSCSRLTTVTLPSSVKSIGLNAFGGCDALNTIYVSETDTARITQLLIDSLFNPTGINFIEISSRDVKAKVDKGQMRSLKRSEDDFEEGWTNQYLGIVPIIVSPLNALVYQTMLSVDDKRFPAYNLISDLSTIADFSSTVSCRAPMEINVLSTSNFETVLSSTTMTTESVGRNVTETCFPQVTYDKTYMTTESLQPSTETWTEYGNALNRTYLNQIGVVVCRMYANPNNDNRIAFEVLESYVGSLDPDAVDDVTGASIYIGHKINTTSPYINFFSNVNFEKDSPASRADIITIANQTVYSMGFFDTDTQDDISYKQSITRALEKTFEKLDDTRTVKIDLVLDAGVSNIAQYISQFYKDLPGKYDPGTNHVGDFVLNALTNMTPYALVRQQFERFCRYTRGGDCMFITDSPRPLSLVGNAKIVRPSEPLNSVSKSILPKLKYIPVLNSCYAAGYAVWFMVLDRVNRMYVWVPPSVKAVGRYIYTDRVARPWYAPAGLNRGIIGNVFDISFNPKNSEAGVLYSNSWNYAINTTFTGIVQEGQRTFQIKPTALDRVNVRRLMSEIEKRIAAIGRRYLYEPLSTANLMFFENDVGKYLSKVQTGQGIEEYVVIADETNNNANTIDNNELHCLVGVRPIKSIEYIFLTFVVTNQSVNVRESVMSAK